MIDLSNPIDQDRAWTQAWVNALEAYPEFREAMDKEDHFFRRYAGWFGADVTVGGCGDGREIMQILLGNRRAFRLKKLVAVDLLDVSLEQVDSLLEINKSLTSDVSFELLKSDVTQTSIPHDSQDTVVFMLTMANFTDVQIDNLFSHASEILKPGGMFVFSIYNEKAFATRYEMYVAMQAPIESFCLETGLVEFEDGFDEASFSRQFSRSEVEDMVIRNGFELTYLDGEGITNLVVATKEADCL